MTCPRLDVRRPQGRGAKLGGKPKGLLIHPGVTGVGKIGRVNLCEPLVDAPSSIAPHGWKVVAGFRDVPL
jgi:hypothetical protein